MSDRPYPVSRMFKEHHHDGIEQKIVLEKANAAVRAGDNKGFLSLCSDDIVWTTVGAGSLYGKAAVREWMAQEYNTPPQVTVHRLIGDDDFVVALGEIMSTSKDGKQIQNAYCDVWRFRDGKMIELKAFVVETP